MSDSLSPLQKQLLELLAPQLEARGYFLAGGTALSFAYLHHRLSEDLDFFCTEDRSTPTDAGVVERSLTDSGMEVEFIWQGQNSSRLKVTLGGESTLIDFVSQCEPNISAPERYQQIVVASLQDLAVNKVVVLLDRAEIKDFVDLYLVLQIGRWSLADLMELAKVKSRNFDDQWTALLVAEAISEFGGLPFFNELKLLSPLSKEQIAAFFRDEAKKIFEALRPTEGH